MPLFNESLESIAQAIVTVKRALKAEAIEKNDYKELSNYLAKRAKDFKIKKADLTRANEDLDAELESEVEEFFMEEDEALAKMAEELLEEYEDKPAAAEAAAEAAEDDLDSGVRGVGEDEQRGAGGDGGLGKQLAEEPIKIKSKGGGPLFICKSIYTSYPKKLNRFGRSREPYLS